MADQISKPSLSLKIGTVGAGAVGATAASTLVMRGIGSDIILVDIDKTRAEAELVKESYSWIEDAEK